MMRGSEDGPVRPGAWRQPAQQREETLDAKVARFESYVNDHLRPSLRKVMDDRSVVELTLAEWNELDQSLKVMQEAKLTKLKTRVSIGCDVFMQAEADSTEFVFVDVGVGFHPQLTLKEAREFITIKQTQLNAKVEEFNTKAANIHAHIKVVMEGIGHLLQLNEPETRR